jgi:Protein of unknown function (DUF4238)
LELLLSDQPVVWTEDTRSGWSRFIHSLVRRNPETVARYKVASARVYRDALDDFRANYFERRRPTDPPTFEEYARKHIAPNPVGRACALLLSQVIDSERVGNHINQMRWSVLHLKDDARISALTSDRPVVKTKGIIGPHSFIIMPLSPCAVFLATNTPEAEDSIRNLDIAAFLTSVNQQVVLQARRYVYGQDDSELRFVNEWLGLKPEDRQQR